MAFGFYRSAVKVPEECVISEMFGGINAYLRSRCFARARDAQYPSLTFDGLRRYPAHCEHQARGYPTSTESVLVILKLTLRKDPGCKLSVETLVQGDR